MSLGVRPCTGEQVDNQADDGYRTLAMRYELKAKVRWSVWQDKQSTYWIATCPPLGLTVDGETTGDLVAALLEAQNLLFVDLLETGDLGEFLTRQGWAMNMPSETIPNEPPVFDIPFELLHNGPPGLARASA